MAGFQSKDLKDVLLKVLLRFLLFLLGRDAFIQNKNFFFSFLLTKCGESACHKLWVTLKPQCYVAAPNLHFNCVCI